jgi:hypothetical protein
LQEAVSPTGIQARHGVDGRDKPGHDGWGSEFNDVWIAHGDPDKSLVLVAD